MKGEQKSLSSPPIVNDSETQPASSYSPALREILRIKLNRLVFSRTRLHAQIRRFGRRFEWEIGRQAREAGADQVRIDLDRDGGLVESLWFGIKKHKMFLEDDIFINVLQ